MKQLLFGQLLNSPWSINLITKATTNSGLGLFLLLIFISACTQPHQQSTLTGINPRAYTDVVYCGIRDSVLVSTYSGRLAMRIKDQDKETVIAQLRDEIYSIKYISTQDMIAVATLSRGVLIIDQSSGKVHRQLEVQDGWIVTLTLSPDQRYLVGFDTKGSNHIWDITRDYVVADQAQVMPNGYIRLADTNNNFYYQTASGYSLWNHTTESILKQYNISGKLVDVDINANLLLLNYNEFTMYSASEGSILFKRKHPYAIYVLPNGDTEPDPYQLKLTHAKFSLNHIYTTGLDKTIRKWDKINGAMIDEWPAHDATVSGLDISDAKDQLVSVDLKGGIRY